MASYLKVLYCLLALGGATGKLCAQDANGKETIRILNMGDVQFQKNETLPIEIWGDLILIRAKVNGEELQLLWDNGFSVSGIDAGMADKIKLQEISGATGKDSFTDGNSRKVDVHLKTAREVQLGEIAVRNSPFIVINFAEMFGGKVKPQGILGASVIKKFNWKFDFDSNTVEVSRKPFEMDGIRLPFMVDEYNNSRMQLGLNGQLGQALVDFGYNGDEIDIPKAALPLFGNTPRYTTIGRNAASVGGLAARDTLYGIRDFEYVIGDTATRVKHRFAILLTGNTKPKIGNRFFRHYNTAINHSDGIILLAPRKTEISPRPGKGYGFDFKLGRESFQLVTITSNPNVRRNPALQLEDEFVRINGREPAAFADIAAFRDYLVKMLLEEKELTIQRKDGKEFVLHPEFNIYQ